MAASVLFHVMAGILFLTALVGLGFLLTGAAFFDAWPRDGSFEDAVGGAFAAFFGLLALVVFGVAAGLGAVAVAIGLGLTRGSRAAWIGALAFLGIAGLSLLATASAGGTSAVPPLLVVGGAAAALLVEDARRFFDAAS